MARKKHRVPKHTTATKAIGKATGSRVSSNAGSNVKSVVQSCNNNVNEGNGDAIGATFVPDGIVDPNSNATADVDVSVAKNNRNDGDVHDRSNFFLGASVEIQREWSKEEFAAIIKKIDSLTDLNEFAYGSRNRIELINTIRTAIRIIADDTRDSNIDAYNSSWHDFEEFDNMMGDLPFSNDRHTNILEWLHPFTF